MNFTMHTDGGSRGNPGSAAIGVVVKDMMGKKVIEISKSIGETTNNQAEYTALIVGLQECLKNRFLEVTCFLDSELVVNQINGLYKVKNAGIAELIVKVNQLKNQFKKIQFNHIVREKNIEADALVNKALDNLTI
ncbi:MAG: ribonuclease HI family protein [bacterium]